MVSASRPLDRAIPPALNPQQELGYLVSVVIPTLNIERFLKESVESALAQHDVECEIIVVDGGSKDGTIGIARAFGERVRIFAEDGLRQGAAINRGVAETSAPYVMVLSGDDVLYPGALSTLVASMQSHADSAVTYAEADFIDGEGTLVGHYAGGPYSAERFEAGCFVPHAAAIVRRDALLAVGGINEALDYAFDFDLWVRLAQRYDFQKLDACVAAIRMHPATKTLGARLPAFREAISVFKKYYGYVPYPWVFAYANYLIDRGDQFFDPLRKKRRSMMLTLPMGCIINFPNVLRFARDWFAARKIGAFLRER